MFRQVSFNEELKDPRVFGLVSRSGQVSFNEELKAVYTTEKPEKAIPYPLMRN